MSATIMAKGPLPSLPYKSSAAGDKGSSESDNVSIRNLVEASALRGEHPLADSLPSLLPSRKPLGNQAIDGKLNKRRIPSENQLEHILDPSIPDFVNSQFPDTRHPLPKGASTVIHQNASAALQSMENAKSSFDSFCSVHIPAITATVSKAISAAVSDAAAASSRAAKSARKDRTKKDKDSDQKPPTPGVDSRTGIVVGLSNFDDELVTTDNWEVKFRDPSSRVTSLFVSNVLVDLATAAIQKFTTPLDLNLVFARLRNLAETAGADWVDKIVQQRSQLAVQVYLKTEEYSQALKTEKFIQMQREYETTKKDIVKTTFADYAQERGFKLPALASPDEKLPVSEEELQRLGESTLGIFNQLRHVMTTRTDSGFEDRWLRTKALKENLGVKGVLEVESEDLLGTSTSKPRSLEPVKKVILKPVNTMHRFDKEETDILKHMRSRLNFLRNPRYPRVVPADCIGILRDDVMPIIDMNKNGSRPMKKDVGGGIIATPSSICFRTYQPFQEYTKLLTVKNRSIYSLRFRLSTPPPFTYSEFFKFSIVSTPSNGEGLIAPGMSATYRIVFRPQSLGNYEELLYVYTELGTSTPNEIGMLFPPIPIYLTGTRDPPELTIPDVLHCGPCRAGFSCIRKWKFKNVGGPGRFIIRPASETLDVARTFAEIGLFASEEDYLASIKTMRISETAVNAGAFEIKPSHFSLLHGQTAELTVTFRASPMGFISPDNMRHEEFVFQIACDNCQVLELPVRATVQEPHICISNSTPSTFRVLDNGTCDVEGRKFDFSQQNLKAATTMQLILRNSTRLKLNFDWTIKDYPVENNRCANASDSDSFSIYPHSGVFGPNSEVAFEVTFSPQRQRLYDVVGELFLTDDGIPLNGDVVNSDLSSNEENNFKIRMIGKGEGYRVQPKPEILLAPEPISVGHMWHTTFILQSRSISPAKISWLIEGLDNDIAEIQVSSKEGIAVLPAMCESVFDVVVCGVFPGDFSGFVVCEIAESVGPRIRIPVHGTVRLELGSLTFAQPLASFGLIALGSSSQLQTPLVNNSSIPLHYQVGLKSSTDESIWRLNIENATGKLEPFSERMIDLNYIPLWVQSFRGILYCNILQPHTHRLAVATAIELRAEVCTPKVEIVDLETHLQAFVGVSFTYKVLIKNLAPLKTKIHWQIPIDTQNFQVTFDPEVGYLRAEESIEVAVTGIFSEVVQRAEIDLFCVVDGMVEGNGILQTKLVANVIGLSIFLGIDTDTKKMSSKTLPLDSLIFDYGTECPLFHNRTQTLTIRNRSGITSPFRVWTENYNSILGSDQDKTDGSQESKSASKFASGKLLLKPTERPKIGFSSNSGRQWIQNAILLRKQIQKMHEVLREGKGLAIHITPNHGILPPFGCVTVQVTTYNNLVGLYNDTLVCEVGSWVRNRIPVKIGIDGVPVKFSGAQLVVSKTGCNFERLNFGTQTVQYWERKQFQNLGFDRYNVSKRRGNQGNNSTDGESYAQYSKKEFIVENQSPRTISVVWDTFIKRIPLDSRGAERIDSGGTPSASEIDTLLNDELLNNDVTSAPFIIQPNPMNILPLKSATVRISFCANETGFYRGLLVASIGYLQANGLTTISPHENSERLMDIAIKGAGVSFESGLMAPIEKLKASGQPFPDAMELPRIRKSRLFVQAKVVEPIVRVSEDILVSGVNQDNRSAVWFKKITPQEKATADSSAKLLEHRSLRRLEQNEASARLRKTLLDAHEFSPTVFIYSNYLESSTHTDPFVTKTVKSSALSTATCLSEFGTSMDSSGTIRGTATSEQPLSLVTISNRSDTTASFQLRISGDEAFRIQRIEKPLTPAQKKEADHLDQSHRMKDELTVAPSSPGVRPKSELVKKISRQSGRVFTPKAPIDISVDETIEIEDLSCSKTVYLLQPQESLRVVIECSDPSILFATSEEDNQKTQLPTESGDHAAYIGKPNQRKDNSHSSSEFPEYKYVKGHLKVIFSNGSVQNIPILCKDC